MKQGCVYLLTNKRNGTLYVGVTSDLVKRMQQHKAGKIDGFTRKYGTNILVFYETAGDIQSAITREKQIKKWNRAWKKRLIEGSNPDWRDLSEEFM